MTRCGLYSLAALAIWLLAPGFAAAQVEKPAEVTGDWERTVETPVGNFTSTLKLGRSGDPLTGVSIGQDGKETKLNDLKLAGKTLTFSEDANYGGTDYHLVYTGTVEGDAIKGTFATMGQTMGWSAKRRAATPGTPVSLAGTWKIAAQTPDGPREGTLALKQDGDHLTGALTDPMGRAIPVQDLSLKGKELRFTVPWESNGDTVKLTFVITLEGDSVTGSVQGGGDQPIPVTGKRAAAPAAAGGAAGTWKLAIKAPNRTYAPTITVMQQAGKWGGQLVTEQGEKAELKEVMVNGNQIGFTADLDTGGMTIHLKFSGTLDGDKLKGTMEANDSSLPTTGDRQPKV